MDLIKHKSVDEGNKYWDKGMWYRILGTRSDSWFYERKIKIKVSGKHMQKNILVLNWLIQKYL